MLILKVVEFVIECSQN